MNFLRFIFLIALISIHMIYRIYLYRGFVLVNDVIGLILAMRLFWKLLELEPINRILFQYILITVLIGLFIVTVLSRWICHYLDMH